MTKDLNRHSSREDIQRANTYIISNVITNNHINASLKTTMRYHLTVVRVALIEKTGDNKCWCKNGKKEPFDIVGRM